MHIVICSNVMLTASTDSTTLFKYSAILQWTSVVILKVVEINFDKFHITAIADTFGHAVILC